MKLKWQQAPVKTQWGDEMVVASVAIDKDHTVCLYCEHDQTSKVEAMFTQRKPLTDEQKRELIKKSELWDMHVHIGWYSAPSKSFVEKAIQLIAAIEAAHGIKENT